MNSVLSIGDTVTYIYKGNVWWRGDKESILKAENPELNDFIFGTELTSRLKH
jgi:phospholipid/cholesterol/gamma-HCH transport system ATP-binding protein